MGAGIAVLRLPHAAGLPLPAYATAGAAGVDVLAAVEAPVTVPPQVPPTEQLQSGQVPETPVPTW